MGPEAVVQPATKIGQALIEEGIINPEQLSKALKVQARLEHPRSIGEVLVEMGLATKKQISARQHDALGRFASGAGTHK